MNALTQAYRDRGTAIDAILADQLEKQGLPKIDLPRLQPFRPLGLRSKVLGGVTDFLALIIGGRRYHDEYVATTESLAAEHIKPAQTEAAEVPA